jgi:hypothetical protein
VIAVINAAGAWVAALVALYSATVARRAAREARASMWQVATLTEQAKPAPGREYRIGHLVPAPTTTATAPPGEGSTGDL